MYPLSRSVSKQLLHAADMTRLRRPNEIVVRNPQPVPQSAKLSRNLCRKLFRRAPGSFSAALNLLPVLVRPRQKPSLDPQRPLAPRNRVAHNRRVRMAQVRPRVHVVNRRGQVKPARVRFRF